MTLAAAWIESSTDGPRTLSLASDSRTRPGPIERVTKVLLFSRQDVAAVWAGDYRYAALLSNHLDVALSATPQRQERDVDLLRLFRTVGPELCAHLHGSMALGASDSTISDAQDPVQMTLIASGYSIKSSAFVALTVTWEASSKRWRAAVGPLRSDELLVIGDPGYPTELRRLARKIRGFRSASATDWRMEPLAALDHFRRASSHSTIGGDLQMAKVLKHGVARAYGIKQPLELEVGVRGSRFGAKVAEAHRAQRTLVDMASWSLRRCAYAPTRRAVPRRAR